jgi:glycosyltransferase involved in cell wall biosynthesis
MNEKITVSIVIPVYNEGENIVRTLRSIEENVKRVSRSDAVFSVDIIYDFHEDNTIPVIRQLASEYSLPLRLIHNPKGGVASAIKTGLGEAKGGYILVTMADMSDDYSILPALAALAKEDYDIIAPSRYMKGGGIFGGPFVKRILSRLAGLSLHWFAGIPTHDATNSYKMYKKQALSTIAIESTGGFEISLELTAKIFAFGGKIVELPCKWWDRTKGKSKFKLFKWLPHYLKWYFFALFRRNGHMR